MLVQKPQIPRSSIFIYFYALLIIVVSISLQSSRRLLPAYTDAASWGIAGGVEFRPLPADVAALPEVVNQRTPNSATFALGNGRYTTLISTDPLHYLDNQGQWQVINPAFQPSADSFVVEQNSIRSRAGEENAWLTAAVGETAVFWQAHTLGVTHADGQFTPLAAGLDAAVVERGGDGRLLHYTNGWSDTALAEEISSAPGSVEHTLILDTPPQAAGSPQFLEMQATLRLLPGAALWADGKAQSAAFVTAGALEIRDAAGNIALVFDPVLAFEQENPAATTTGEYAVRPGDTAGTWIVGVRTPWAWWADPGRHYPAVIDPTIRVLTSTGSGSGMAWVRSNDNQDYTVGEIILGAHLPTWQTRTRGYVQFNELPALLTNAGVQVKSATLEVTPTGLWIPSYYWKGKGFTHWDSVYIKRDVHLNYIGACPVDCNKFSLHDDRVMNDPGNQFHWDNSLTGTTVEPNVNKQLTAGTYNDGVTKKTTTTWDVTGRIQQWYQDWYDGPYPRSFPTFMLEFTKTCGKDYTANGTYINFDSLEVGNCSAFGIYPGNIQLLIEYEPLPLSTGTNTLINRPGVPSYRPGVFENNNTSDTNHEYDLNSGSGSHWRAVAVRGNHAIEEEPNVPTRAGLQLWDDAGQPTMLAGTGSANADTTAMIFIDDHHSSNIAAADLHVEVTPADQNDFAHDQERNYRLQYVEAEPITLTNGRGSAGPIFSSTSLIWLTEFPLTQGDNVTVKVEAPEALDIVWIQPAGSGGKSTAVNPTLVGSEQFPDDGSGLRKKTFTGISRSGTYALALVNRERPFTCVDPDDDCVPGEAADYFPVVVSSQKSGVITGELTQVDHVSG